jgi:hypothetical protein
MENIPAWRELVVALMLNAHEATGSVGPVTILIRDHSPIPFVSNGGVPASTSIRLATSAYKFPPVAFSNLQQAANTNGFALVLVVKRNPINEVEIGRKLVRPAALPVAALDITRLEASVMLTIVVLAGTSTLVITCPAAIGATKSPAEVSAVVPFVVAVIVLFAGSCVP